MKWARDLAAQALAITSQDWTSLGFSDDPQVAPSSDIDVITQRIVALLAIRSVAMLSTLDDFEDFSTTSICRSILLNDDDKWPAALTEEIVEELRGYVKRIVEGYEDVPYHNREHCYHVVLSSNKVLDLMLNPETHSSNDNGHEREEGTNGTSNHTTGTNQNSPQFQRSTRESTANPIPKTFGLRRDALQQFALLFAALIHDVQHGGVSNRQLALEDDPISIVYNDASVLEQQSLTIAFTEFLQPEFANFRKTIFPNRDIYNGFRKTVVNLVLATDIANPDRMQITKDKWKTAFGDNFGEQPTANHNHNDDSKASNRRESGVTEITMARHNMSNSARAESRRRSIGSMFSDITLNIWESGDEGSLSDSSDGGGLFTDQEYMMGMENTGSSCTGSGHHRSYTPDSSVAQPFLQKIDECAEKEKRGSEASNLLDIQSIQNGGTDHTITSQDLGYTTKNALSKEENGNGSGAAASVSQSQSSFPRRSSAMRTNSNRRGSTTSVPEALALFGVVRRASAAGQRRASFAGDHAMKKLQRRLSAVSTASCKTTGDLTQNGKRYKRLGIMRSIDLGGETIESYSRKGSMGTASMAVMSSGGKFFLEKYDEPDEFRATVVLETMLLSCDVAHNLQSWDHMLKWSHRLYWELLDANKAGRGFDPAAGWSQGQAGFLQGYMLPLGEKLGKTGVFGVHVGKTFASATQGIIETWEAHGEEVSVLLMSSRNIDRPPFR